MLKKQKNSWIIFAKTVLVFSLFLFIFSALPSVKAQTAMEQLTGLNGFESGVNDLDAAVTASEQDQPGSLSKTALANNLKTLQTDIAAIRDDTVLSQDPVERKVQLLLRYIDSIEKKIDALPVLPTDETPVTLRLVSDPSTGSIMTNFDISGQSITVFDSSDAIIHVTGAVPNHPVSFVEIKSGPFPPPSQNAPGLEDGLTAPFVFKGGAYPGTGGTCGTAINIPDCTIVISFIRRNGIDGKEETRGNKKYFTYSKQAYFVYKNGSQTKEAGPIILKGSIAAPESLQIKPLKYFSGNFGKVLVGVRVRGTIDLYAPSGAKITSISSAESPFSTEPASGCLGNINLVTTGLCEIKFDYIPTAPGPSPTQDIAVRYSNGMADLEEHIILKGEGFVLNPEKNLLIVYNGKSSASRTVKDYYLAHRPGFSNANVLAVTYPDPSCVSNCIDPDGNGGLDGEKISPADFEKDIRIPISDWVLAHADKKIWHIVLMPGIPSRFTDGSDGVFHAISQIPVRAGTCTKYTYPPFHDQNEARDAWTNGNCVVSPNLSLYPSQYFYSPDEYPGTLALVTSIDMGSVPASKAYIDKLAFIYNHMNHPSIFISAKDAGLGGTTYYLDNAADAGAYATNLQDVNVNLKNELLDNDPHVLIDYRSRGGSHITQAENVLGFTSWGVHGIQPYNPNYAINFITFSGNSNWYLINTFESFNGMIAGGQGNFISWFSSKAFSNGNQNAVDYSHTPVGALTHVEEPGLASKDISEYFTCWENNGLFIDCVWQGGLFPFMAARGDPWVRK